jgi:acetyltransferase
MSIRNLDALFRPRSIALIGASNRPGSVGLVTARNLLGAGFEGPVLPVNPKHQNVAGVLAYPDIASLPVVPDLAVICTPPKTVPGLIAQLGKRGTKGAVVVTAGFSELGGDAGHALQREMLEAARPHLLRIIGPNCLGVLSTASGVNASFAPSQARKGGIAFVTQSGAMATTVLDWANARAIGFSHLVSLGDMADVDFGDMLDYLASDARTTAILLYIEAVTSARKFMSAARAASRLKPVIVIKAGRHREAAKAAASHTGALAGTDAVYDAAFRRAGIVRASDLDELFDAVETIAHTQGTARHDLVILTNGGGAGVLATDILLDHGGHLTELSADTLGKLNAVLPPTWSHGNPVDIIGDAQPSRYADALKALLEAPETNAILVINCPTAIASSIDAARTVATQAGAGKTILANWLGVQDRPEARQMFANASIPAYDTPTEAIRGFSHLVQYRKGQQIIVEAPSSAVEERMDEAEARKIVAQALATGRTWLAPEDVQRLMTCYRIPMPRAAFATTAAEAAQKAGEIGTAVALKIVSKDILHKSDVGGVALNLEGSDAVRTAADSMLARVAAKSPGAAISGFLVQEMIARPGALELILGITVDAQFGPVILFGHGGTAVEAINDKALGLPPLNLRLAQDLIGQTRVVRLLRGYRDHPPAAVDAIALTLVKLSQLVCDLDDVAEIDINPLLADSDGVITVDARVRVAADPRGRGARLAILPYPTALESTAFLPALGALRLRPIKPEDAERLAQLIGKTSPQDLRMRFFNLIHSLSPGLLARFTQIDYDRDMAFIVAKDDDPDAILGVGRLAGDPDNVRAEFAILVRTDLQRRGMGRLLMQRMIGYAKMRGLAELAGDVLAENIAMRNLCAELGFKSQWNEGNDSLRVTLTLSSAL